MKATGAVLAWWVVPIMLAAGIVPRPHGAIPARENPSSAP